MATRWMSVERVVWAVLLSCAVGLVVFFIWVRPQLQPLHPRPQGPAFAPREILQIRAAMGRTHRLEATDGLSTDRSHPAFTQLSVKVDETLHRNRAHATYIGDGHVTLRLLDGDHNTICEMILTIQGGYMAFRLPGEQEFTFAESSDTSADSELYWSIADPRQTPAGQSQGW